MTAPGLDRAKNALAQALARTPDCVPIERLAATLDESEQTHLSSCARCQAERALCEELTGAADGAQDGAAVQWIAAELRRRRSTNRAPARTATPWGWLWSRGFAAAAAMLVVAVASGYFVWDREPALRDPRGVSPVYRSAEVKVVEPSGDVLSAPPTFVWVPIDGAIKYDVAVLEIDRTVLWRGSSMNARVTLPPAVTARFVPGKTVLWEITARDASGKAIAESGTQRFRVVIKSETRGD